MKRILSVAMTLALLLCSLVLPALAETKTYPDGVLQWWSTGQPEFRKQYFDTWLGSSPRYCARRNHRGDRHFHHQRRPAEDRHVQPGGRL